MLNKNNETGDDLRRKIFILQEIYGLNNFIKEQCTAFKDENTEVESISLYPNNKVFPYSLEKEAYTYFIQEVGFDDPLETISELVFKANEQYDEVILIGFSVGATLAWRLTSLPLHRVICVYGSRIRQYLDVRPNCPTLVLLPSYEKSFHVNDMKKALHDIHFVQTVQFDGEHGFMDRHNPAFHLGSARMAYKCIKNFIKSEPPIASS